MLGADEPDNKDNFKKAANCAQLDKDGAWRDRSCRRKYKFVCEKKDSERLVTERRARMQHASGPKDLPSSSNLVQRCLISDILMGRSLILCILKKWI